MENVMNSSSQGSDSDDSDNNKVSIDINSKMEKSK